jgi:hypothetical protein
LVERAGRAPDGWFLEKVTVTALPSNDATVFKYGKWLSTERGDGHMSCTLAAGESEGGPVEYELRIYTGKKGTHATVNCLLVGATGRHGPIELDNGDGSPPKFEKNGCTIVLVTAAGLGHLEGMRIGHDSHGWLRLCLDFENPFVRF